MSFASLPFVGLVTAGVVLYYLVPKRAQWVVLLLASTVFYLVGGVKSAVWLVLVAGLTWLAGLLLEKQNARPGRRAPREKAHLRGVSGSLLRAVISHEILELHGLRAAVRHRGQASPVGFRRAAGPVVFHLPERGLCHRRLPRKAPRAEKPAEIRPVRLVLPADGAGADQLAPQLLAERSLDWRDLKFGIQLCLWGYFKKLVIADRAAVLVNAVITENCPYGGAVIASGILFYCIQLYCDFSGGIDITRSVARMFGIDMAENFRRPIFAMSLTEYWRRWHITLGAWMRDYVFYPLSLSKAFGRLSRWARTHIRGTGGKIFATSLATFIVYLIIGIWHGANFRYIAFGLWNGVLITASLLLERTFLRWKSALHINDKSAAWRVFMTLRTMLLVFIGRYFTRSPRLSCVFRFLKTTVLHPQPSQLLDGTLLSFGLAKTDFLVIALGLAVLLTLECLQERGVQIRAALEKRPGFVQWLAVTALLLAVLLLGVFRAGYIPSGFIYTQF